MARLYSYGYYSESTNKYGWSTLFPTEGPWYGGRRGDTAITPHHMYGLNYPPPVPENFTIEYYPITPDSTPLFMWIAPPVDLDVLQYVIEINFYVDDFTSPTQTFTQFSATALATANWWSYVTPIENSLIAEGTYYARIKSTDGFTWSAWSDTLEFEYKIAPPPPPTIDPVTSPTDQFIQTICGTKTPNVYVFIRNNGGDWQEVDYTYGREGGRWCYIMTLEAGDNVIEAIASWSQSRLDGVSNPAYAFIHTIFEEPEPYTVWNAFDEFGLLVSLDRLTGEKNKAYKKRILDVYENPGDSTYQGLINSVSRELGIAASGVTVERLSDLADITYAGNLLNTDGSAIGTRLEAYAKEVYDQNPIFWGTLIADESIWDAIDEDYSGLSYLPHLWDPTASGIYAKWQKAGIGDQDDLWVNDINSFLAPSGLYPEGPTGTGMMEASGIVARDDYWRAPVHSGYFYVLNPEGVLTGWGLFPWGEGVWGS